MSWIFDGIRLLSEDRVYNLTLRVVLVLTILVLVTLNAALIFRVVRNGVELRRARIRRRVEPRLMEYLQGDLPEDWMIVALKKMPRPEIRRLLDKHFRMSNGRALDKLASLYVKLNLDGQDVKDTYSWAWWKRATAVRRLGLLRTDAFRSTLVRCLQDKHDLVRIEAARALARLGDAAGMSIVCDMIDGPSRWQSLLMAELAAELGDVGVSTLRRIVAEDTRPFVRANAIDALAQMHDLGSVPLLRPLLRADDAELRVRAVKALGQLGANQVLPDILELTTDDVWQVRAQAVKSIGRLARSGDPQVTEALVRALSDKSWWVRYNTANTLMDMGERGAEILSQVTESSPDAFARDMSRQIIELHELETPAPAAWGRR